MAISLSTVVAQARDTLIQAGIDAGSARHDAEELLIAVLGLDGGRSELAKQQLFGATLSQSQHDQFQQLVQRRARREPLQLILGSTWFSTVELTMAPGVFIPRPETETLVEYAARETRQLAGETDRPLQILDLCTGTGAIAIALSQALTDAGIEHRVRGVELTDAGTQLARHNAAQYPSVTILQGDATLAPSAGETGSVDLVVSNPPYIPHSRLVEQPEASQDPAVALYGGSPDGTRIPLQIADAAAHWLVPGRGVLLMEHDHSHADTLREALAQPGTGWIDAQTLADLTGAPRFLCARRNSETPVTYTRPHRETSGRIEP